MKFISAVTAALCGTVALAAPTASSSPGNETTVYQIQDFTTRKYDGENVATVFLDILATNGGTLDFECVPYDPVTNTGTQAFESGKVYFCGENSFFSFSYDVASTELFLWQEIATDNTIGGKITTGNPICRAGGSSAEDLICTVPAIVQLDITLEKL